MPRNDRNTKSSKDFFMKTLGWEEDRDKFRGEIDGNRSKIEEL
mgnify:CR=1 FL=1